MKGFTSLPICLVFVLCSSMVNCFELSPVTSTQNNYTVTDGNVTCVVMTTSLLLTIPYVGQTNNLTATVPVPSNFSVNGSCANSQGENTLNIYFFDNTWELAIVFKNTSDLKYEWAQVNLSYTMDDAHFPNANSSQVNKTIQVDSILPNGTNKAPMSGSYQCDGSSVLKIDQEITLTFVNLHYRAFGVDSSKGFTTYNVQNCNGPIEKPETPIGVTVAIGIAIAVLIVLVIVLYLLMDKILGRSKLSYD